MLKRAAVCTLIMLGYVLKVEYLGAHPIAKEKVANSVINGEVDVSSLMSQLSELQQRMIGGGNEKDHTLKAKLTERKRKAVRRSDTIAAQHTDWDSEEVIEGNLSYKHPPFQLPTY